MLDCIQNILDKRILEPIPDDRKDIQLRDRQSGMKMQITEIDKLHVVIRLDKVGHLPGLKQKAINKKCDYLLFVQANDNYHVIFVELKKTYRTEADEQLRCSRPILDYLLSACNVHCNLKPRTSVKYAIIAERFQETIDKQPVKVVHGKAVLCKTYKQIRISTFLAPRIDLETLLTS